MDGSEDKIITVRIPVAIDVNGDWIASGFSQKEWNWDDFMEGEIEYFSDFHSRIWITAELAIPNSSKVTDPKVISANFESEES